jgi:diguanylate cyclase (GGDEF)-like protein
MGAGVLAAATAAQFQLKNIAVFGPGLVILGCAMQWTAARRFERRAVLPVWVLAGPAAFLAASFYLAFDLRVVFACTLLAGYCLAAAQEFVVGSPDRLGSRWAVVALLILTAAGYLSWLPLIRLIPIHDSSQLLTSHWSAMLVLITLAGRIALAFMVLALAKERRELEQRVDALTDPLTGLPNRRALVEAAHELERPGAAPKDNPIAVLLFDLDHFKEINDAYGHRLGDHVLRVFAETLSRQLDGSSFVARMGGEEFAAILPGANQTAAVTAAESVRSAFESSAACVEGVAVRGTVSVGACSDAEADCDLGTLFHRADTALYRAKSAGRNCVVLVDAAGAEDGDAEAEWPSPAQPIAYERRLSA